MIDDDLAVHDGTRFALCDYQLNGHRLEILSAFSAKEGRELMQANPDIAAVLLDVIMETDEAGLDLVEYIRNDLKNETVRIILRTGQPGQAPERRVIVDYDINDYKAKTELTADKLFTSLTAALRSYQQLQRMVETRRGLEIIIDAASTLYDFKSMQRLAEGVLTQIASLLNVDCAGILVLRDSAEAEEMLLGAGRLGLLQPFHRRPRHQRARRRAARRRQGGVPPPRSQFLPQRSVLYIHTGSGREVVVLLEAAKPLSDDRPRAGRGVLQPAVGRVRQRHPLRAAAARPTPASRSGCASAPASSPRPMQRLSAQWTRLQRANDFKSEILGTVAHDLRNPLAVILGRTEMLTEMVGTAAMSPESINAQIGHIRSAANRVTEMVNNLIPMP